MKTGHSHQLVCPQCGTATTTADSRSVLKGTARRRRRECPNCAFRFATIERAIGAPTPRQLEISKLRAKLAELAALEGE